MMTEDTVRLKNVLRKQVEETGTILTDVVMAYDASGSVSEVDFQLALQAGVSLTSSCSPNTRIAIIQFSSKVSVECGLSMDRSKVQRSHFAMRKRSGGTNTHLALQQASEILQDGRDGAVKIVYLFTDGVPENQTLAIDAAQRLRASTGAQIIGVGIGNVSKPMLSQVCGDTTFVINDYESLLSLVPTSRTHNGTVPGSEVTFVFTQTKKPVGFKEPFPLKITIKNPSSTPVAENSILEIECGEFFDKETRRIKGIREGDFHTVDVELSVTGNADITTLPGEISINLLHPTMKVPYFSKHAGFQIELCNMVGDIVDWRPKSNQVNKANILVFGPAGAGKSTLINSIFSLWFDSYSSSAPAMDSDDHVTLASHFYQDQQGFAFLDTVGLSDNNYLNSEFSNIIKGALPVGFEINNSSLNVSSAILSNIDRMHRDEIHACIFVVPQGFRGFARTQPEKIRKLREFIQESVRKGMPPLLAMTRLDEVDPSEHAGLKKEFKDITGISERDIFLIDNSSRENKSFAADKVAYQLLRRSLDHANQYLKKGTPSLSSMSSPMTQKSATPSPTQRSQQQQPMYSQPPAQQQPSATQPRAQPPAQVVDFLSIYDVTHRQVLGDVYETFDINNGFISLARQAIQDQLGDFNFQFVNTTSQVNIAPVQEGKAKLKLVFDAPNGVPSIIIRTF